MQERKLEKGVGYITIFRSNKEKYEISANGTVLRWTFVRDRRVYEYLFERVSDLLCIRKIEEMSENWKVMDVKSSYGYYVILQANAENKYTGNIKIVKQTNAVVYEKGMLFRHYSVEAGAQDYSYYVRRKR